ncbi:MAG TPA: hypothetical protein VGE01_05245 [Fimbriimonas sp.]
MQYDHRGRMVKNVEQAESFIRHFMVESTSHEGERFTHSVMEYDLYLPWLMEVVENMRLPEGKEPTPTPLLERIYMEAAWNLCMAGYLRMGPRKAGYDNARDAYGKGYSLTYRGEEWLRAYQPTSFDKGWPELLGT